MKLSCMHRTDFPLPSQLTQAMTALDWKCHLNSTVSTVSLILKFHAKASFSLLLILLDTRSSSHSPWLSASSPPSSASWSYSGRFSRPRPTSRTSTSGSGAAVSSRRTSWNICQVKCFARIEVQQTEINDDQTSCEWMISWLDSLRLGRGKNHKTFYWTLSWSG